MYIEEAESQLHIVVPMANYSYTNGDSAGIVSRFRVRFQSGTTEGWSKSEFLRKTEVRNDHVCRPVIVDADGRVMPGVVECSHHDHHHNVEGNIKENKVGYNKWNQSEGLKKEEPGAPEFIANVQAAASEGGRMGFPRSMFRRREVGSYGGYGSNDGINANGWGRPGYEKYEFSPEEASEPTMITSGGWARRSGRAVPPEEPRLKATNDIGTASNYLRESAKPQFAASTVPDRWSSQPKPTYYGKNDRAVTRTIDSREAAKKYGDQSIPMYDEKNDGSATTIDSKEAAKKYGGQFIF